MSGRAGQHGRVSNEPVLRGTAESGDAIDDPSEDAVFVMFEDIEAGAAAGAFLAGFVVLPQPSVNPAPSGSPTHVTRDRDPRGDGWVAPLWWIDGVGQADPSHLRLRRT